ncbi:MAG TPA: hypothetical protein VJU61_01735 [Polyangiaceae bacterium]|nr:hypothetical protein [Polyangiaceae bacterium]
MTPYPRARRPSAALTCLVRWCVCWLVVPLWLALQASVASAASLAPEDEAAPMCDPRGASVLAGVEIPEVDRGQVQELPCDALIWMLDAGQQPWDFDALVARRGTPAEPPHLDLDRTRPEAVIELRVVLPLAPEPLLLALAPFGGLPACPGYRALVYRPPVSRG